MRKQKGFSLIELLIVVAIILIIAAIAIPNLLRAKISANESSAVGSLRNIVTQEIAYNTTYPTQGYATAIVNLGPGGDTCPAAGPTSAAACLIDAVLAGSATGEIGATKSGYGFAANGYVAAGAPALPLTGFAAAGVPISFNSSGTRNFCVFEDGVMRALPPNSANTGGYTAAGALASVAASTTCTTAPWYVQQ